MIAGAWLAVTTRSLNLALTEANRSRARADAQSEFLIGKFADSLERIGRLDLIIDACQVAEKLDRPEDDEGLKRRARLLLRWASAEWAGGDRGLGVLINVARGSLFDIPLMFATLATLALLGVTLYLVMVLIERRLVGDR